MIDFATLLIKRNRMFSSKAKSYLAKSILGLVSYSKPKIKLFLQQRSSGNETVQQSPFWMRATLMGIMGSTIFGVGWISIAKTDEIVTVVGKLEPRGSVQEIQMPLGGIASEILVKDGEEVEKGQIVMRLDAETSGQRLMSLTESQKLKKIQLNLKESELEQYLLLNSEEVKTRKSNNSPVKSSLSGGSNRLLRRSRATARGCRHSDL